MVIRIDEKGERVPLTVADLDAKKGTITVIFKAVGKSTKKLGALKAGDSVSDCVGPMGRPDKIRKFGRVVVIGGGTGIACIYPLAKALMACWVLSMRNCASKRLSRRPPIAISGCFKWPVSASVYCSRNK